MAAKPRIDTSRNADIRLVVGGSGSGKSSYIKKELKKRGMPSRISVWDPVDEYGDICDVRVSCPAQFLDYLKRYPKGALKIRFVAEGSKMFALWAAATFAWCNAAVVAEEIADVTNPSKAPEAWGKLLRRGRARGLAPIFGVTQRPAESDKTILGNSTRIRTGRLGREQDRVYMAREMNIDPSYLDALQPLDFIERDMKTFKVTAGNLKKPRTLTEIPAKSAKKSR